MNWQTAADSTAPEGWKISGFDDNVGDKRQCKDGWNAFARDENQGTLSAKMKGTGIVKAKYRDCWSEGHATVYLNGTQKDQSGDKTGAFQTTRCSGRVTFHVPLRS